MKRIPVTQASYKKISTASPSPKGVPGSSVRVGKIDKSKGRQASYLGMGGFGGFGRPTMIGASSTFYNNSYMNGGRSGGMGDVPPWIALMNEMNGGVLYYPTTLKEKYEFYRYFYRSNPYVKAATDLNTDLPLSRLQLRMPKMEDKKRAKKIQRFYENMIDELRLFDKLHSTLFEQNIIGNCFPAGHCVHTLDGSLPIEQVRTGDNVLTERGTFENVSNIMRRKASEYLYDIKINKLSGIEFSPTGEHPVFILKDGKPSCIPAKELKRGDYVSLEFFDKVEDVSSIDLKQWFKESSLNQKYNTFSLHNEDNGLIQIHCEYETNSNKTADTKNFERNLIEYFGRQEFPFERRITDIVADIGYPEADAERFYHVFRSFKRKGIVDYHTVIKSIHERTTIFTGFNASAKNSMRMWDKDFSIPFNSIHISNEFLYLLGYFYGDGWVWNNKRPMSYSYHGIDWLFCKGSEIQFDRCRNFMNTVFGNEYAISDEGYFVHDGNRHIVIDNPMFAEWWVGNFGSNSRTKKIPLWIEMLPVEKLKWLMAGLIDSDGCVSNGNVSIVSINEGLLKSIFRIGLKCGVPFNFSIGKSRGVVLPDGNHCISSKTFKVDFNGRNEAFANSLKYFNRDDTAWKEIEQDAKRVNYRWFYKINDISKKFFNGFVYNLEVENEHTYCVNGICTHNCFVFVQYSEEKKRWDKLTILPPEEVNVANYPMSDVKQIQYRPEMLNSTIMKYDLRTDSYENYLDSIENLPDEDRSIFQDVSYEFARQIKDNNGILKFDSDPYHGDGTDKIGSFVFHFANKRHEYQDLGVSPLECIMTSLLQKTHYMFTQLSLASRNMTPRNLVVAEGITLEALEDLRDQVDQSMLSPDYSIVTNYDVQWEQLGAENRLIDLQRENEVIENELFAGLGVTRELLTGEGMYSGNKISIEILNTKYLLIREVLQRFVEDTLFKPVALQNGFYEDDEDGNRTWFYPKLGFTRLTIRDNQEVFDQLFQLYQKGSIPVGMVLDIFNINSEDVEDELKKDLFTVKDATYNEMLRQVYSSVGDKIVESTDLVKQIAESIVGPKGKILKYTGEDSDAGEEGGGDDDFGIGGDSDTGGKEESGFSLDDANTDEEAKTNDEFSLDDTGDESKKTTHNKGEPSEGGGESNVGEKVNDYIDSFKSNSGDSDSDSKADEYIDNIVGDGSSDDESANKYIDSFLEKNGSSNAEAKESSDSTNAQDAVLADDDSDLEEKKKKGDNDVGDFITGG